MRKNLTNLGLVGLGLLACFSAYSVACTTNETNDANNGSSSSSSTSSSGSAIDSGVTDSGDTTGDGSTTTDGGDAGNTSGGLGTAKALHKVTGLTGSERVTGIWCEPGATTCVLAAMDLSAETLSHISSFDTTKVSATPLVVASDANSATIKMLGDLQFLSFNKVGSTLIANLDTGAQGFIFASGDPTVAANWHVQLVGDTTPTTDGFGLNHEYGFGFDGTTWVQMREGQGVYTTTGPTITATSAWTNTWAPGGTPEVPADLEDQKAADATICNDPVSYSVSPTPVQAGFIAADASIILYPVGSINEDDDPDGPGICISTDKGKHFHVSKLTAVATAGLDGPTAIDCTSKDHCVAGGSQVFTANSTYIYVSNNASSGATSTWTKATIPAITDNTYINSFFFAPDGTHGWAVGSSTGTDALLWATTDGGATWTDATASISGLGDPSILFTGFAADATHYIIGGRTGLLYSTF